MLIKSTSVLEINTTKKWYHVILILKLHRNSKLIKAMIAIEFYFKLIVFLFLQTNVPNP